jgi:cytochrome c-type biogenesis protein CcmE
VRPVVAGENKGLAASLRAVSKGLQIALGALVIAGLLGWYAATNLEKIGTFQYYQSLAEFQQASASDQPVRVHGYVALGSIERDVPTRQVRFRVVNEPPHQTPSDTSMPVLYGTLETPDMFQDGAEVVLEGRMTTDATFVADNVMAKCPSKFEAETAERAPF